MERLKEKGAYFEGSDKKYPDIELRKYCLQTSNLSLCLYALSLMSCHQQSLRLLCWLSGSIRCQARICALHCLGFLQQKQPISKWLQAALPPRALLYLLFRRL